MAASKVLKLINRLGREFGSADLRTANWDAAGLIASQLGKDPAELQLEAALGRLIRSCREEAELSLIGRIAVHRHIIELLCNLARLRQVWGSEAEDVTENIVRPVFITGLPRTGSTLLHTLLAQDPAVRVPRSWEVMRPPTAPGQESGNSRYCERRLRWARRLAPGFQRIHPLGAMLPEECIAITAYTFRSIVFHTTENVPAYQDWLENSDQRGAYRFHRRFLQHLQKFDNGGHWVLKAPGHMFGIDALAEVYPDAVIVQTHRDPLRVAASLASHTTVLRSAFSQRIDRPAIASDWLGRWWSALDGLLDFRETTRHPVVDVYYDDVMANPLEAVASLYADLGWQLSPEAKDRMSAYLAASAKGEHTRHRYSLEEFGLERDSVLHRLQRYLASFPVTE